MGMEPSEGSGRVMDQGSGSRRETMWRRTIGGKGKETEMATEEENGGKEEKVERVQLYLQQLHHPPPHILLTSHLQRKPSPRWV